MDSVKRKRPKKPKLAKLTPEQIYKSPIYRCVAKEGGVTKLANRLGVTRQAVHSWLLQGFAPPMRAIQMEEIYRIPRFTMMDPRLAQPSKAWRVDGDDN